MKEARIRLGTYRVVWNTVNGSYEVQYVRPEVILIRHDILPGTAAWFAWLARIPSFAFRGKCGHFTARKERRVRGGVYWVAYQHRNGKLKKKYIGTQAQLTMTRLEDIAGELEMEMHPKADA